jgi:hypothetical protein
MVCVMWGWTFIVIWANIRVLPEIGSAGKKNNFVCIVFVRLIILVYVITTTWKVRSTVPRNLMSAAEKYSDFFITFRYQKQRISLRTSAAARIYVLAFTLYICFYDTEHL